MSLQVILHDVGLFHGEKTTLSRVLKEMGFSYKSINNKRYYYEQSSIIEHRHSYLRRVRRNHTEGRPVVYLDETAHDGKDKAWVEQDKVTGGTLGGVKYVCCMVSTC